MNHFKERANALREYFFVNHRSLSALKKVKLFSEGIDGMLSEVYAQRVDDEWINLQVCLVALGGYGRGELCPHSDVDILFLHSEDANQEAIASAVRYFWDMGLNLGCVVRSAAECSRILGEDFATDTALLQARFIAGNKRLFRQLETAVLRPYFEKNRKRFIEEIRLAIKDGIFSRDNSLYRVEPEVKNGICALRDCQRILWAERVLSDARSIWDLYHLSHFDREAVADFSDAYELLTAVRSELHLLCARRMDVLESGLQPQVAENLGFGTEGAGNFLEAYFKSVRTVKYFALSFLERRLSSHSLLGSLRSNFGAIKVKKGLIILDGILSLSTKDVPDEEMDARWLIDVFRIAQRYQATVGVDLANRIREAMKHLTAKDFRMKAVDEAFFDILSSDNGAGRALDLMHETGVLAAIIPAFSSLTCKVEYDSVHEFTVDQHILLAVRALSDLATDTDTHVRTVYCRLANKFPLRLALLLHDIGKAMPGDHTVNGKIIAAEMCDRLGVSAEDKRIVVFLVYNHLELSRLAFGRELEDQVVQEFADRVAQVQRLDMLYLLTVLDIRYVGSKSWTGWRAYLLENAYERVLSILRARESEGSTNEKQTFDNGSSAFLFPEILPEDEQLHELSYGNRNEAAIVTKLESFAGFDRLSVLSIDQRGFFADITGCISSEGYNILSARVSSTAFGRVLDIFHLEFDGATTTSSPERVENVNKKWRLIESGAATAEQLVKERIKLYPPRKDRGAAIAPRVRFDNKLSKEWTVIELEAQDCFGLLYRIARCLSSRRVNIASALMSTRIDRAVNTFYVNGPEGGKITDDELISSLTNDLIEAMGEDEYHEA